MTPEQEELIERKIEEFAFLITLLDRKRHLFSMYDKTLEGAIDGLLKEIINIVEG